MRERDRVVVRADASPELGLGHVNRSLAVAHELVVAGCSVTVCGSGIPSDLLGGLPLVPMVDAEPGGSDDALAVSRLEPDLVLVDGYHFTAGFFAALDERAIGAAVIDDNGDTPARRPLAVVNQNPHASPAMYGHLDGDPLLMIGPRFAMLRQEFAEAVHGPPGHDRGRVLLAFGGSDPLQLTEPIARRLASAGHPVRVAVGPAHPRRAELVAELDAFAGVTVTDPADYAHELAAAGTAVLAAGSSVLEAAALGTPTIAVVVAANQRPLAAAALERGMVREVLDAEALSLEQLTARLCAALEQTAPTVDPPYVGGGGARRVAGGLVSVIGDPVRLRPATIADARFLFTLRTDAEVRRWSFGPAPSWEQHLDWLRRTVDDPDRRLFVVETGSGPVGQVRLDASGADETVSLAITDRARAHGIGRRVLGALTAFASVDLLAHVKPDNERSIAVFSRAGFAVESANPDEVVMRWSADHGALRGTA